MRSSILLTAASMALLTGGCTTLGNLTSIYRSPDLGSGDSLVMDAEQWAVLNVPRGEERVQTVCAMPSPDALAAAAASGSLSGEGAGGSGSGSGAFALGESSASIGLRTQSIQLLRDALYRMCEANANGAIDDIEMGIMMRRFQTNMVAILAIEQLTGAVVAPPVAVSASSEGTIIDSVVYQRQELRRRMATVDEQIASLPAEATPRDEIVERRRTRLTDEKEGLDTDYAAYTNIISAVTSGDFETAALLGQLAIRERSAAEIASVSRSVESITLAAMSHNYQEEMCYELDRMRSLEIINRRTEDGNAIPEDENPIPRLLGSCPGLIESNTAERGAVPLIVGRVVDSFLADRTLSPEEVAAIRALLSDIDHRHSAEDLRPADPPARPPG